MNYTQQTQHHTPEDLLLSYIFPDFKPEAESRKGRHCSREKVLIVNEYFSGKKDIKDKLLNLMINNVRSDEKL